MILNILSILTAQGLSKAETEYSNHAKVSIAFQGTWTLSERSHDLCPTIRILRDEALFH